MYVDAALTLRSPTVTAAELSVALGVEADDSWEPTDSLARRRSPRMRRGDHGWALRVSGSDPIAALDELGGRLGACAEAVRPLVDAGDVAASVVLFTCDGAPSDPVAIGTGIQRLAATVGTVLVHNGGGEATNSAARVSTWVSPAPLAALT